MDTTGFDSFNEMAERAHVWLREVGDALHLDEPRDAYIALRAVLHALRDCLDPEESAHFSAQLPMLLRGVYYDGWVPPGARRRACNQRDFIEAIHEGLRLRMPTIDPEWVTRGVLEVLSRRVSEEEVTQMVGRFPKDIRDLWPKGPKPGWDHA